MSVRVRLTRVGSKKNPIWRVVIADQRSPRDGRFIETIGRYNPQTEPSTNVIDEERLRHWLARGAQPTGTVRKLIRAQAAGGAADASKPDEGSAAEAEAHEGAGRQEGERPADRPEPEVPPAPEEEPASPAEAGPEVPSAPQEEEPATEAEGSGEPS